MAYARSLMMFQSLLPVAPLQPVRKPTPISLARISPPNVKLETPLHPPPPDAAVPPALRAARSSTSASAPASSSSSSSSSSRMWRCDLGCGQQYERSSGRSIRRHVLACFRRHWPGAASVTVSRLHELISEQQEAGVLVTGLRRWKMRQSPRKPEQLEAESRWECPRRCGKRYRNTSTRSISKHKATCCSTAPTASSAITATEELENLPWLERAQHQQQQQQQQQQEHAQQLEEDESDAEQSETEARDAGDDGKHHKLRRPDAEQEAEQRTKSELEAEQLEDDDGQEDAEDAEPPYRRQRSADTADSAERTVGFRSPFRADGAGDSSSPSQRSFSQLSTPPSMSSCSSSSSSLPAAFASCFSSLSSARSSHVRPAPSSSWAAEQSSDEHAAVLSLSRTAGMAREGQSHRHQSSSSVSASAASLHRQRQDVAAYYQLKEQQRLTGMQMHRLVQQIAANYGTQHLLFHPQQQQQQHLL